MHRPLWVEHKLITCEMHNISGIILIGEIGGTAEEDAAALIKVRNSPRRCMIFVKSTACIIKLRVHLAGRIWEGDFKSIITNPSSLLDGRIWGWVSNPSPESLPQIKFFNQCTLKLFVVLVWSFTSFLIRTWILPGQFQAVCIIL